MQSEERYWKDQAEKEKAKRLVEEERKNKWIFVAAILGIFAFIVIAPWFDSVFGLNIDQASWLIGSVIFFMVVVFILLVISNYRKK